MSDKRKKILIVSVSILVVLVAVIAISYAYFRITLTGGEHIVKIGELNLVLNESSEGISLSSQYGISDSEGMNLSPSTFEIVNNGNKTVDYTIYLDDMEIDSTDTRIDDKYLKYNIVKNSVASGAKSLTSAGVNPNRIIATGSLTSGSTDTYSLNLWISDEVDGNYGGHVFKGELRVVASQEKTLVAKILANNPIQEEVSGMFNYTNDGDGNGNYVTNGLYSMEDEDGISYYFRGNVNNIVQFGSYEEDYYVYRYTSGSKSYDYQTLEQCQTRSSSCSESNKVLKYTAGTPMYWRIVRVNGDGTLRLLYSGTSVDATGDNLMIGYSQYNTNYDNPKYAGYTYDNGTDSTIKKEVDTWYGNALSNSSYDKYIATGRFCSDSIGFDQEVYDSEGYDYFASYDRLNAGNPTLKCPTTSETYGGSYTLKAGLMTADEMVLGGDKIYTTSNNYLSSGSAYYWTMSPAFFYSVYGASTWYRLSRLSDDNVDDGEVRVRPVSNLLTDNGLTMTGSGTVEDPYVITVK